MGAAYGTAKSGVGIAAMAIMKPELIMKSVLPVVMAGIVAIYGVVVAVLISTTINDNKDISKVIRAQFTKFTGVKLSIYSVYCKLVF
jgi:V-type H+-transporting ATPase proteolipid subunit